MTKAQARIAAAWGLSFIACCAVWFFLIFGFITKLNGEW